MNTLTKQERLSGKTAIAALTSGGKWGHLGHIKFCVADNGLEFNRILVSVPKRFFKRAVKRNLLKRRIREAYRTQKSILNPAGDDSKGKDILLAWNSQEIADSESVKAEIAGVLRQLQNPS